MSFHLSLSVRKRYLFERIARHYVFSRCSPPATSVFCVLFSVVLPNVVGMLLSFLLYAQLFCIFSGIYGKLITSDRREAGLGGCRLDLCGSAYVTEGAPVYRKWNFLYHKMQ
jgi:hypothetical protein